MAKLKTGRTPRDEAKYRLMTAMQTEADNSSDELTDRQNQKVRDQMVKTLNSLAKKWKLPTFK